MFDTVMNLTPSRLQSHVLNICDHFDVFFSISVGALNLKWLELFTSLQSNYKNHLFMKIQDGTIKEGDHMSLCIKK